LSTPKDKRNYQFCLASNFTSTLGDTIGVTSLSWWVISETKSAAAMGLIMTPAIVASIIGPPFCGLLADSISRKKIIMISELALALLWLIPLIMFSVGYFNLTFLACCFFIVSLFQVQLKAAASGILPDLIKSKDLQGPMAKIQAMNTIARIIGGVSSAIFLQFLGMKMAFIFNILTFIVSVYFIYQIDIEENFNEAISFKISHLKNEFFEGFKYFKEFPALILATCYMVMIQFFTSALPILLPSYVKLVRDLPPWYFGILEGSLGVGAVVGTLLILPFSRRYFPKKSLEVGIVLIIIGALLFTINNTLIFPIIAVLFIQAGFISTFIPLSSGIIANLPATLRSRVYSIVNSFVDISALIGIVAISAAYTGLGHNVIFRSMAVFYFTLFCLIVYKGASAKLFEAKSEFRSVKSTI